MSHVVPTQVDQQIYDDAVEEAIDIGLTGMMAATMVDPACLRNDVDLEYGDVEEIMDDEGNPSDMFTVRVTAKVGKNVVFVRDYDYDLVYGGITDWEDV